MFAEFCRKNWKFTRQEENSNVHAIRVSYSVGLLPFPLGYSSTLRWDGRRFHASFLRVIDIKK
ncbi:hypothetical protein M2132_002367 [Dysgonomonas sp. PH5-45]|nr:hypothetical protein [Dysgonomonas sp. PH5-45]MDH6388909.1 hypothetical protein [Dysgonomonas sp. PH5-37]NDV47624.1 hypothetical protein [Paludibacter sp. 221]